MKGSNAAGRFVRAFRTATAPLDWLEFAVFVVVALGVGLLIVWTFTMALIDELRRGDWLRAAFSLGPLILLAWAVTRSVLARRIHWMLMVFVAAISLIAFYLLFM